MLESEYCEVCRGLLEDAANAQKDPNVSDQEYEFLRETFLANHEACPDCAGRRERNREQVRQMENEQRRRILGR